MRFDPRQAMLLLPVLFIAALSRDAVQRASPTAAPDATGRIVAAAQALATSLDDAGRAKLQFRWDDNEQRQRWSNLPSPMVERRGIRMGDLTDAQRAQVATLLKAALSADGFRKVTEIMRGDEVLRTGGGGRGGRGPGGGGPAFGLDNYWLAFLGVPSTATPWMLQFGGHHLAINLTLAG